MDLSAIVEEAAAGVVAGFVLWLSGRMASRWRPTVSSSGTPHVLAELPMEDSAMGRPGHISPPDLPRGPHRDLVEFLHRLLAQSGMSGRAAARASGVAHGTFQKALSQPELPTQATVMSIALALAEAIDDRDGHLDDVDMRTREMWRRADQAAQGPDPVEVEARKLWGALLDEKAFILPDIPGMSVRVLDILCKATGWSFSYDDGTVRVGIELPKWDWEEELNANPGWEAAVQHELSRQVGKYVPTWVHVDVVEDDEDEGAGYPDAVS